MPRALRIVAVIQLLYGVSAALSAVVLLLQSHISLNASVLGIPIYYGLLRFSSGWRTCALVLLWFGMLSTPVLILMGLMAETPAHLRVFGMSVAAVSPLWFAVASILGFMLDVWQYRVLTRPAIRALFPATATGALSP